MGHLIVYPDNKEKLTALKAFMKALKITFLEEKNVLNPNKDILNSREADFWTELPEHVRQGIKKSQKQAENNEFLSFEEVKKTISNR